MTSHQGQLQALITEIEALLGRAAPKLPWMVAGESGEQRRVMEQTLAYLQRLQGSSAPAVGGGLVASQGGAIAPPGAAASPNPNDVLPGAESQQMLQALLQEMQYLRAQMVQPLTSEVIALQQQRETLKNEVRQLEQQRQQQQTAVTPTHQPHPDWINDIVEQLRAALFTELAPLLRAGQNPPPEELTFYRTADQNLLSGSDSLPQLSPQQRLEQLRQVQSQTDGMLLKLDANLRAVFESLDQSIQSYCDTLNQGLGDMHGLGQQGEFIFRSFINHLAEQLQEEGGELAEQLASQQEQARLQGRMDDSETSEEAAVHDELMNAVVDLDDVELGDLDEFDLDADLAVEEEVTLFQLDEELDDWSDNDEAADDSLPALDHDAGEATIVQTEPIAWAVATGQTPPAMADDPSALEDEPTVAYTEEIDALYDNLFGQAGESLVAEPSAPNDGVDDAVDEQLLKAALSEVETNPPIAEPQAIADVVPVPEVQDTSLDLNFLLETDDATDSPAVTEADDAIAPSLETLLGAEMAAELSPNETTDASTRDTIASLAELLPESEPANASRHIDPFTAFDEAEDTFIPAPPDENLLDTESEVARTQVDLTLDDETLDILSTDLSRLEDSSSDVTLEPAAQVGEAFEETWDPVAPELTLEMSDNPQAESVIPALPEIPAITADDDAIAPPFDTVDPLDIDPAPTAAENISAEDTASGDAVLNDFADLFTDEAPDLEATPEADAPSKPVAAPSDQALDVINEEEPKTTTEAASATEPSDPPDASITDSAAPSQPDAAIADAYMDFNLRDLLAPEDDADTSAAEQNADKTADALDLLEFEPVVAASSDAGEEIDLLARLELDDLELFDESTLRSGATRDRAPATDLDLATNPASEPDAITESLDNFFALPDPKAAAPSAPPTADNAGESEPPTLDPVVDESSTPPSAVADSDQSQSSETTVIDLTDQAALMSALFDEPSTTAATADTLSIEDVLGDTDTVAPSNPVAPSTAADTALTLENSFEDTDAAAVPTAETLSIETFFGDVAPPALSDSDDAPVTDDTAPTVENTFADTDAIAALDEFAASGTLEDFAAAVSGPPSDLDAEPSTSLAGLSTEEDLSTAPAPAPESEPSLTLADITFESVSDEIDSSFDLAPLPEDDLVSDLSLGSDLFAATETTADDTTAAVEADLVAPELRDSGGSDDSLASWSAAFGESASASNRAADDDDSLDFEELAVNFSLEAESDLTSPQSSEEISLSAADLFSELSDAVTAAPTDTTDRGRPPSPDGAGQTDSPQPAPAHAATTEHLASALTIAARTDEGVQVIADAPNDALMQSLANLPDDEVASANVTSARETAAAPAEPSSAPSVPELPDASGSVSGSAADGYQLSFTSPNSATVVERVLTDIGEASTEVSTEASTASPSADSSRLQKEYGRRLTSLTNMVAATSLPFTTAASLSNIPEPDSPLELDREAVDGAIAAEPKRPDAPSLPVTGSVEAGFAIALPDSERALAEGLANLPDADANFSERGASAAATVSDSSTAPLTNEELATLFPSETAAGEGTPLVTPADDRLTADDGTVAELFPPSENPNEADLASPTAIAQPPNAVELEDLTADLSRLAAEDSPQPEGDVDSEDLALSQALADLDLSMTDIPESEIALDDAFQVAFEDDIAASESADDVGILSEAAIADLDALSTDQAFMPDDWETDQPAEPTAEFVPEPESVPELIEEAAPTAGPAVVDEVVFASAGMLATLGDDDPDGALPEEAETSDTLAAEWFLGIDLGTSGLSAVLMEQHSGSAHPLCWVSDTAPEDTPADFRIPAVVTVSTPDPEAGAAFELRAVGQAAIAQPADSSDQQRLHTLRPFLRAGIPYQRADGTAAPQVQWSDTETLPLQHMLSAVTALLQLVCHPADAGLQLTAIGLETDPLADALASLQGVVVGLPTNWSDTYCFNLREAVLATGLVESPNQVFVVEEAIAAILSGLPDPSTPAPPANRSAAQPLYQCHWQGGTVVVSGGAACTEVGIVDLPQPLDAVSREDFQLRNLAYGGDALDLDIICQLLVPAERRQPLGPGSRRPPNRGWGWQAALPEVANAQWNDLQLDTFDLPQLAEPDVAARQRLRQHLEASKLGQSLLEAARYLKLILQNQNQYQLELADQSWRVLRRDLESRVLVPYIQRINQQVNGLLSQTGLASQGINQVICTGGNASFSTIAKWLRQKFPNATIIQDTYPSDRPQTCSRVAYGLVNLCRYPQVLDVPRHQYSDYFLLHEMMRVLPDAPLPFDGILHLLEEQGINVSACQPRIAALLEGHLPPGLLPDVATRELLSRETLMSKTYQDLAAGSLFSRQTRNIYVVNTAQRDRLFQHLAALIDGKQQSLAEPLFAQLVSV